MAWRIKGQEIQRKQRAEHAPKYQNLKWRFKGQKAPGALPNLVEAKKPESKPAEPTLENWIKKSKELEEEVKLLSNEIKKAKKVDKKQFELKLENANSLLEKVKANIVELTPKPESKPTEPKPETKPTTDASGKPAFLD